jgi:hypothetical protein
MVIEKAGVLDKGKPGADKQILEEFFGDTSPNSVTVDGKVVLSRFNTIHNDTPKGK